MWADEVSFIFTGTGSNCDATSGTVSGISYETGKTGSASATIYNSTNGLVLYGVSSGGGYFNTTTAINGSITNVAVTTNNKKNSPKYTVYGSTDGSDWTQIGAQTDGGSTVNFETSAGYTYVKIANTTAATAQLGINSIVITYTPSGGGGGSSAVATTTTITSSITNTDVYVSTAAGSLSAAVTETESGDAVDDATVTWSSSDENVATINASGVVTLVAAGSVTFTASYAGVTGTYTSSSNTYNMTVTSSAPYVQPTEFNIALNNTAFGCGTGNNATEQSLTSNNTTVVAGCTSGATNKTNYQSGHVRFYADSYLHITAPTGYNITKVVFTADGTWNGSITVNKGTYDNESKTWDGATDALEFSFAAQNRASSIAITLAEPSSVEAPTFSVAAGTYYAAQSVELACVTDGTTIYYTTDGTDPTSSSTEYTSALSVTETTTIKAIAYKGGDASAIVTAKYVIEELKYYNLVTSIVSGKHYVIASGKDDGDVKVLDSQAANNRSSKNGTVSENRLTVGSPRELIIQGPDVDGYYTIYDAVEEGYLYAANSSSNYLRTKAALDDNGRFSITFDSNAAIMKAQGSYTHNWIRNNGDIFSCYESGQSDVYLFALEGESAPVENITIGGTGYATYCSNNALNFSGTGITAYMAKAAGSSVTLTEIADGIVPAREGVVLMGATDNVPVATALGSSYNDAENELVGITERTQVDATDGAGKYNYILSNEDEGIGFYAATDGNYLAANKAYLSTTVDPTSLVKAFLGFTEGDADAISEIVNGKSVNGKWYDLSGRRVSKATKGIYIVNGKKVVK